MWFFNIDLGVWRKSSCQISSSKLSLKPIDCRESGRFYFINQIQLIIDNDENKTVELNNWKFSKMVELHDGTQCYNTDVSEKIIIKGISPQDEDFELEVNGKIKGLDIDENLFNTIYAISCCNDLESAKSLVPFLRENSLLNYNSEVAFSMLLAIREIIISINMSYAEDTFVGFLKRIYKQKYKVIVQNLINEEPKI